MAVIESEHFPARQLDRAHAHLFGSNCFVPRTTHGRANGFKRAAEVDVGVTTFFVSHFVLPIVMNGEAAASSNWLCWKEVESTP